MNTFIKYILVLSAVSMFIATGCSKDDDPAKPSVTITELGADNGQTVVAGTELHIEAEITADGKINTVVVTIHHEEGADHVTSLKSTQEWEEEIVYTEFTGKKNAEFHKHIDVPADAEPGSYHIHITVTDMEGYEATAEGEFTVTTAE
ncbi:MAG: DUF4625 domain-containing protein [Breznakibacter sp.]